MAMILLQEIAQGTIHEGHKSSAASTSEGCQTRRQTTALLLNASHLKIVRVKPKHEHIKNLDVP